MPVDQLGQQSLFARGEPLAPPLVDERVEQDAVFDGRLALAHAPESLVVERGEGGDGRRQIVWQRIPGTHGRGQGQGGLVFEPALVLAGPLLQLVVHGQRQGERYRWLSHQSSLVIYRNSTTLVLPVSQARLIHHGPLVRC